MRTAVRSATPISRTCSATAKQRNPGNDDVWPLRGETPIPLAWKIRQKLAGAEPLQDVITDDGDIIVPVDPRYLGLWLTGLFGDPNTTDNGDGSFDFRGAKNTAAGCMLTVTLTNDLDGTVYA